MEFILKTTGRRYTNLKNIQNLERLGFTFEKDDDNVFKIHGCPKIEINSMEELIQFSNKIDCEIIIGVEDGKVIEIYNDCRE